MHRSIPMTGPTQKQDRWTKRKEVLFSSNLNFAHSIVHESSSELKRDHLNPQAQKV